MSLRGSMKSLNASKDILEEDLWITKNSWRIDIQSFRILKNIIKKIDDLLKGVQGYPLENQRNPCGNQRKPEGNIINPSIYYRISLRKSMKSLAASKDILKERFWISNKSLRVDIKFLRISKNIIKEIYEILKGIQDYP